MTATRERILDAAERLFGEHGFHAASLRAITAKAGVNLAAVNYHFRTKEDLIQAVFARRLEPLNQTRLALLTEYEAAARGKPKLEQIVEALVGPVIRLSRQPGSEGAALCLLVGRLFSDPSPQVRRIFLAQLRHVIRRFTAALQRSLPGLDGEELFWRVHFSIGALAHTMTGEGFLEIASEGVCKTADAEAIVRRLVSYIAGGFKAPVPPVRGRFETPGNPLRGVLMGGGYSHEENHSCFGIDDRCNGRAERSGARRPAADPC